MQRIPMAFIAALVFPGLLACGSTEPAPSVRELSPSMAPHRSTAVPTQEGALTAGFASVDMTWRAGAKPGQVGTEANLFQVARIWGQLIELIARILPMQAQDQVVEMLEYATDWTVDHINSRFDEIRYDLYVDVYQPGRGIHTPSYAKAMVLEAGGEKVAIVRADLYLMQKTIWRRVAELVAQDTGLAPENILIAATHNHSAADAAFTAIGISTLAENFDPRHFVWITQKIAAAIIEADQNRVPATMGAIHSQLRAVQRNIIGPATGSAVPPGETEAVEVQAGYPRDYFDDDLWILYFDELDTGSRLGAMVTFGMHPESLYEGHGLLSSDFVGLTEVGLENRWGGVVMWTPGSLGDIEPDDGSNFGTDFWREDFRVLDEQTDALIEAIGPVLEDPQPSDQIIDPTHNLTIAARLHNYPGAPNSSYPTGTEWMLPVTEYISPDLPIACARALTETANIGLQAIQIGEVLLLGSPSEVTTDMAKHIRTRLDSEEGNLYQGYVWPEAEAWVEAEIYQNFDQRELDSETGFLMPIVINQVNDYLGYMVTRWEFTNRKHYRQEMTLFGEDTANYVAGRFEGLARELRGSPPETLSWDEPSEADLELENQVYDAVANLEPWVSTWAAGIPADDPRVMGRITQQPSFLDEDEMGAPSVRFSWRGGTSDVGAPQVQVQQLQSDGAWAQVLEDSSPHLWLLYSAGGRWEAVWHRLDSLAAGVYRFRVTGPYRGDTDGDATPDPIWDPAGRNRSYDVASSRFDLL